MKKFLAIALVATTLLSLVACGGERAIDVSNDIVESIDETIDASKENEVKNDKKIGSISKGKAIGVGVGKSGLHYTAENGKYGIMSFDGKSDTGAKYTYCSSLDKNFMVATTSLSKENFEISSLNRFGVVNANGKELIPMQYANIKLLNDRFYMVFEVTEQTENEDEALVYYTDNIFSIYAQDEDVLLKGVWYVYDANTAAKVDNASGTKQANVSAHGSVIKYTTAEGETVCVNSNGEKLPDGIKLFENGWYSLQNSNNGAVYDSNGNKQFEFASSDYMPIESNGDYFVGRRDGKYVLLDKKGATISAELSSWPTIKGDLMLVGKTVCDLTGKTVIDGEYTYLYFNKNTEDTWFLKEGSTYTLIDKNGTVLYQETEDSSISIDVYSTFNMKKTVGGKQMYYSFKDKDYTIEGIGLTSWMVQKKNADNTYEVVDIRNGEVVVSGHNSYSYGVDSNHKLYIYGHGKDAVDIYAVD